MLSLLQFFAQLCLLRSRPQDLPSSQALFTLVAAVNIVIGTILVSPAVGSLFTAFMASLLDTLILATFVWALLRFRDHSERFFQTATSAIGVSVIIASLSLPLQWMMPANTEEIAPTAQSASLMLLVLIVWLQVALGHVFRHAFDVSLMLGIGLAFLYTLFSGAAIQSLFNFPTPA